MSTYDKASLVLIPSGTKEGVIFSQKPTNGDGDFTFSRSTAATRVNSDGLIEKETQNLLLQSNSFDTTWTKSASDLTSGQSGYDGSNDAWLLTAAIPSGFSSRLNQVLSPSASGVLTLSVYAKANTLDWILLDGLGTNGFAAWFDVSNGVKGQVTSTSIGSKITSVGNGWYRCEVFGNATTLTEVRIYVTDGDGTTTANDGDGVYIQDAQLEQGLVARDYIETTTAAVYGGITDNVPRLDYTDSSCPALLLEPQRTNLVTQSEYFGSSDWLKTDVTLDFGYEAPDGTNSAYKVTDSGANAHIAGVFGGSIVAGVYKSIWAKTTSGTGKVNLLNVASDTNALFDITNEWQRFDITHDGANFFYLVDFRAAGTTLSEVLIWGAQAEVGSYATSYIPTYGTSVTRNGDSAYKTGISSLIGQTEGTLFLDFKLPKIATPQNHTWVALKDSAQNNRILVYFLANSETLRAQIKASGSAENFNLGTISNGDRVKIAIAYKSGDSAIYINGLSSATSTNALSFGTMDIIDFNDSSAPFEGDANKLLVFPTRLSNEELEALTQA